MNGKMAKMLRRIQREDSNSKRQFNAMNAETKGTLRKNIEDLEKQVKAAERPSDNPNPVVVSESVETE